MSEETTKTDEVKPDVATDELRAKLEAATREAEKLKAAEKKRRDESTKAEQEAAAKKAVDDGKASETIKQLQAQLAAIETEREALQKREASRVDKLIETLPESAREKLSAFKDKLSLADYAELVEAQVALLGSHGGEGDDVSDKPKPMAPPAASPAARRVKVSEGRELQPQTREILNQFMVKPEAGERLEYNEGRFGMSLQKFVETLRKAGEKPTRP